MMIVNENKYLSAALLEDITSKTMTILSIPNNRYSK